MIRRISPVGEALRCALWTLALVAGAAGIHAQQVRDPTLAPASASSTPATGAGAGAGANMPMADAVPVAVIVREGRPFLVVGTRLFGQGQMLGDARIERITETEVWLREGKTLRKRPVFTGIERRAAVAAVPAPTCLPSDKTKRASTRVPVPSEICPP